VAQAFDFIEFTNTVGSIKGDVKKKHFSLIPRKGFFLTSSPFSAASLPTWCGSVDGVAGSSVVASFRAISLRLQAVGWPWPTMVLSETRDQARHYSFIGLSEGAYGAP